MISILVALIISVSLFSTTLAAEAFSYSGYELHSNESGFTPVQECIIANCKIRWERANAKYIAAKKSEDQAAMDEAAKEMQEAHEVAESIRNEAGGNVKN